MEADISVATESSGAENKTFEDALLEFLRVEQADDSDKNKKKKGRKSMELQEILLLPNRLLALAVDNSLRLGLGYGLDKFSVGYKSGPLAQNEQRKLEELPLEQQVKGSSQFRSIVVDRVSGATVRQEFPRPSSWPLPTIHKALDQGAIGWPASIFMDTALQLRSTSTPDPWHRLHNDMKDALVSSGVWLGVCERTVLYNASTAPWGGHAFFGVLSAAAREYFSLRDWRCPLFGFLYKDLGARRNGLDACVT